MPETTTREDLRKALAKWYDGYSWDGLTKVYNPWNILYFFNKAKFRSYWYESGGTSFIKHLFNTDTDIKKLINKTTKITSIDNAINDLDKIKPEVLLFQTGYLTIIKVFPVIEDDSQYSLGIPNTEIAKAIVPLLLKVPPPEKYLVAMNLAKQTKNSLLNLDMEKLERSFGNYLAVIPFGDHVPDENYSFARLITNVI
jgi:hypothetical protein